MLMRRGKGHRPQLIFTSDFHELERGERIAGPVVLRYDPYRIVPSHEMAGLPATQHAITAHCRFHPHGSSWDGDMRFPRAHRMTADYDPTGQGTMLETVFPLPAGCSEVECWFSYVDNGGRTLWDSEQGENYWMRFPSSDLEIRTAELADDPSSPFKQLRLEVNSVSDVEKMLVRWRYTAIPGQARQQQALTATDRGGATKTWAPQGGALRVSAGTPIAFDLVYTANGHEFTDDNEGNWYVVAQ